MSTSLLAIERADAIEIWTLDLDQPEQLPRVVGMARATEMALTG